MIGRDMRLYEYALLGEADAYGQMTEGGVAGTISMAVYVASQAVGDSVLYQEAQYIGLTSEAVTDRHIVHYEGQKLKVLYVQPKGRWKQAFMAVMP